MLNDEHFKVVTYKANSTEVFPSVDIKGGVAVMYRDATQKFGKIGSFATYPELRAISDKVKEHHDFCERSRKLFQIVVCIAFTKVSLKITQRQLPFKKKVQAI